MRPQTVMRSKSSAAAPRNRKQFGGYVRQKKNVQICGFAVLRVKQTPAQKGISKKRERYEENAK